MKAEKHNHQNRLPDSALVKRNHKSYLFIERVSITDKNIVVHPSNPIHSHPSFEKGASTIQATPAPTKSPQERRTFTKRIGLTTYRVGVHFSNSSSETMNDKIMRLVKNEAADKKAVQL